MLLYLLILGRFFSTLVYVLFLVVCYILVFLYVKRFTYSSQTFCWNSHKDYVYELVKDSASEIHE